MATIREVAEHAQVSVATVSHVINRTRFVDPETQERVQQSIKTLGYRPNLLARSLRRRETRTIGLLVPDNANPFFAEFARVVEDAGFADGYSVILCNSDRSETKEEIYIDVLLAKQVDGLIVISATDRSDLLQRVLDVGVPLVVVDRNLTDMAVSQVLVANEEGGYLAGQYLLGLGHRQLGCIGGPSDANPSWGRVCGFTRALDEAGVFLPPEAIMSGDFRYAGGEAGMCALLDRDLGLTAVFATNDLMAIGAVITLQRAGLQVPGDISVIGFDNILQASTMIPSLTTIEQPVNDLGQATVRLLLEQILKQTTEPASITIPTKLVERESCRAIGVADR
ncbi:MAG: LacI family DNA-binding transcriptional regulator [Roseiflexaceae bacterium]